MELSRSQAVLALEALAEAGKWYEKGDPKRQAYSQLWNEVRAQLGELSDEDYNEAFRLKASPVSPG